MVRRMPPRIVITKPTPAMARGTKARSKLRSKPMQPPRKIARPTKQAATPSMPPKLRMEELPERSAAEVVSLMAGDYTAARGSRLINGLVGCRPGRDGRGLLGRGDAQHGLAILAFDQLPADVGRYREDFAALEVGAE